ncbi:hypothetical protein ScPMuIL_012450 [Solemya velum]
MGGTTSAKPGNTCSPENNESDCSKHNRRNHQISENMPKNPKQDQTCPTKRTTSLAIEVGSMSNGDAVDTFPNQAKNSIQVPEDCYVGTDHCVTKPNQVYNQNYDATDLKITWYQLLRQGVTIVGNLDICQKCHSSIKQKLEMRDPPNMPKCQNSEGCHKASKHTLYVCRHRYCDDCYRALQRKQFFTNTWVVCSMQCFRRNPEDLTENETDQNDTDCSHPSQSENTQNAQGVREHTGEEGSQHRQATELETNRTEGSQTTLLSGFPSGITCQSWTGFPNTSEPAGDHHSTHTPLHYTHFPTLHTLYYTIHTSHSTHTPLHFTHFTTVHTLHHSTHTPLHYIHFNTYTGNLYKALKADDTFETLDAEYLNNLHESNYENTDDCIELNLEESIFQSHSADTMIHQLQLVERNETDEVTGRTGKKKKNKKKTSTKTKSVSKINRQSYQMYQQIPEPSPDTSCTIDVILQRFSDVRSVPMSFQKTHTIADILCDVQTCMGLHEHSGEIELYHNLRRLQPGSKVGEEIDDNCFPARINVCVVLGERHVPLNLRTNKEDMVNPWEDDDRSLMPCGHAITPSNLYGYCWSEIQSRKAGFKCPGIVGDTNIKCGTIWAFAEVVDGACLSVDEMNLFSESLNRSWLNLQHDIQLCPECGEGIAKSECKGNRVDCVYCNHAGRRSTFCFICMGPWDPTRHNNGCGNAGCSSNERNKRSVLQNCERRTIIDVDGCPSVRACPGCMFVIEYTSDGGGICKHMECPTCHTQFCFVCLRVKPEGSLYWPCGGAYEKCIPASVQELE